MSFLKINDYVESKFNIETKECIGITKDEYLNIDYIKLFRSEEIEDGYFSHSGIMFYIGNKRYVL